jgi:negative regulator of sigma E activity
MMNAVRFGAGWLMPYAAAGMLTIGLCQGSLGADDPRAWLDKMNQALATRNYDGTFFHLSEGRVETMRIVHRVKAGLVTERLQSLDGSGREFVRNNDELTCYLPTSTRFWWSRDRPGHPSWARCPISGPTWTSSI